MCYFNLFALTPYNRKILLFSLLLFFPFMEDPTVTTPLYEPPEAITGRRLPDEHKFKCDIWAIVRWQSILSLLFPLFFRTFVSLFPPSSLYPSLSLLLTFSLYSLSFVSSLSASPYRLQHFFLHYGARFFFRAAFLWKWQTGLLTHTLVLDIIYFKWLSSWDAMRSKGVVEQKCMLASLSKKTVLHLIYISLSLSVTFFLALSLSFFFLLSI